MGVLKAIKDIFTEDDVGPPRDEVDIEILPAPKKGVDHGRCSKCGGIGPVGSTCVQCGGVHQMLGRWRPDGI